MTNKGLLSRLLVLLVIVLFSSCVSSKKISYFNNISESSVPSAKREIPKIHKTDILAIAVSSLNAEASTMFNPGTTASSESGGFLVNESGYIQFPVLGSIKAEDLTVQQLTDTITHTLIERKLLVSPIVTIRFLNFRVTVLGEVAHPTVLNVPNQRISILEAIGLAGDLTETGKRTNILIIHEDQGKKTFARVDLTSKAILSSPEYFLHANDVVYVEQSKNKLRQNSNLRQLLPVILSVASIIVVVLTLIVRR